MMRRFLVLLMIAALAGPVALRSESCAEGLTTHTVMVDRFDARDATVGDVLEALTLVAERVTNRAYKPNFIIVGSGIAGRKVTITLRQAPLSDALDRIGELTGVTVTYTTHDTVLFSGGRG